MFIQVTARWILTLALIALIVILSVTPGEGTSDDNAFVWLVIFTPTFIQKFMHFTIYGTLVFLMVWAQENTGSRVFRIVIAFSLAVALGTGLEWYQIQVPGRTGTILDVLLNASGAVIGLIATLLFLRKSAPTKL